MLDIHKSKDYINDELCCEIMRRVNISSAEEFDILYNLSTKNIRQCSSMDEAVIKALIEYLDMVLNSENKKYMLLLLQGLEPTDRNVRKFNKNVLKLIKKLKKRNGGKI